MSMRSSGLVTWWKTGSFAFLAGHALLGLGYGPQVETRQVEAALQELVKTTRE